MKCAVVASDCFTSHITGHFHPERPERYTSVIEGLIEAKLVSLEEVIKPQLASREDVYLCHTKEYVELVEREVNSLSSHELRMEIVGQLFFCFRLRGQRSHHLYTRSVHPQASDSV